MKTKGFTLIELLIVMAIIAILAAIAVPNFLEAQTRAKISRVKADVRAVATALESYYVDNNRYITFAPRAYANQNQDGRVSAWPLWSVWLKPSLPDHGVVDWMTTPIAYITSVGVDPFGVTIFSPGVELRWSSFHYITRNDGPFDWDTKNLINPNHYGILKNLRYIMRSPGPNQHIWWSEKTRGAV